MASFGQASSRPRDALHSASGRLYKFALVLTMNEDLARALLRSTFRSLSSRKNFAGDDRDHMIDAFRRMYALWSSKLAEDPSIQNKCQPDSRLFAASFGRGAQAGGAHFAKFMASLPAPQRAALYLVYGEGTSYDEAADVTAVNMLALMRFLARGHTALLASIDQQAGAGGANRSEFAIDPPQVQEQAA